MSTTIVVSGHAEQRHPAERGTARINVSCEASTRGEALAAATRIHSVIVGDATRFVDSGDATKWIAEQVWARSAEKYANSDQPSQERQIIHYAEASTSMSVTFADFDVLGEWLAVVGAREGAVVNGISWSLTDSTRTALDRALRILAVADARERATAYAEAAHLTLGDLVAIYEPGLRPYSTAQGGEMVFARSMAMDSSAGAFSLSPEDILVSASISADFLAH